MMLGFFKKEKPPERMIRINDRWCNSNSKITLELDIQPNVSAYQLHHIERMITHPNMSAGVWVDLDYEEYIERHRLQAHFKIINKGE